MVPLQRISVKHGQAENGDLGAQVVAFLVMNARN